MSELKEKGFQNDGDQRDPPLGLVDKKEAEKVDPNVVEELGQPIKPKAAEAHIQLRKKARCAYLKAIALARKNYEYSVTPVEELYHDIMAESQKDCDEAMAQAMRIYMDAIVVEAES